MRIYLHIGPEQVGADRLQQVLADNRDRLAAEGILFARSPGNKNHTRLFMAVTDPDHIDPLRHNRGYADARTQAGLRDRLARDLAREVAQHRPETLILSASQLGASLHRASELDRLAALLEPLSDDIRIIAHVEQQARLLARVYGAQVLEGRGAPLSRDLDLAGADNWWQACLDAAPRIDPQAGVFIENQAPPFWLDFTALVAFWETRFGAGAVTLRPHDATLFASAAVSGEIRAAFDIRPAIDNAAPAAIPDQPAAAWLTRARRFNALILQVLAGHERILPRKLWRTFLNEMKVAGDPIAPGSLSAVSARFRDANKALRKAHPALSPASLRADRARKPFQEADPAMGFRASQYLLAFLHRIDKATRAEHKAGTAKATPPETPPGAAKAASPPQPARRAAGTGTGGILPPLARQKLETLRTSALAPHNRLGAVNEEEPAAAYTPVPPRRPGRKTGGNVIVGCMKNEAPYIVEWVAYHRAIGIDNFLIYTNGCSDGTTEILDRLQEMGVLEHRNNDNWKGNSPQQYALNQALKEPLIRHAGWIIHIDVDEFINIRTGNGMVQDFLDLVPDATNVAMTWRLFGHNGIERLSDEFVIDQFDTCAPKYCPKPHTVWGFKTMFKNIGAYEKISCHRPNKLDNALRDKVRWVNGSGRDMTAEAADNGWRNSRKTIGYDLLQLNHYALRSTDSFLIKRQRGRALHVDRSIGLNYWIRMDWSDFRDITIKRNIPRLRAEYDRLMADETLRDWHHRGLQWHKAKAEELRATPEFAELFSQTQKIKLNEVERVAYALALDMES